MYVSATKDERADILNHWSVGPLGEFGEWEEQRSQISLDLCRSELKLEDCRAGRDANLRSPPIGSGTL